MSNNIAYETTPTGWVVYLNRKTIGKIMKVDGGYQYFPMGSKSGGEILSTIEQVKKSLEED